MAEVYSSKGIPQMEVFSVIIVPKHSQRPLNLYGSITVCSFSMPNQSIYKREREDPDRLPSESKCFPILPGAAPQIIPCGDFYTFDVDLKHRVEDSDVSSDEEVCKGLIDKEDRCSSKMKFNELLNLRLDGKECSIEFGVGFYEKAAKAHVTATLINLKVKDIRVCGQIASKTSLILNASKHLFNKKPKEGIMVHDHDGSVVLPLPCSVAAAPLDSELTVSANLYACGSDDKVCTPLVKGTANFFVKEFGMSVGVISGSGCDFQIEVDWLYF